MKARGISARNNMGYVYILPWILGFLIFQLYPLVSSFYYSLTDYSVVGTPNFIGLANYVKMFTSDKLFFKSLGNTMKYVFTTLPMKLVFALIIAVILNQKIRFISFYRTAYYIPSIFGGSVAVSVLWRVLFMNNGIVNRILNTVGLASVPWLSHPSYAMFTVSLLNVWQFGSSMVLFLAALKQVPEDLYEAARIDGAGSIRIFFKITLPMISSVLMFNILMQMVGTFQEFTGAFVITDGGPVKSTYLYALKLYDEAFSYYHMGYACALSWVLFILILVFTVFFFRFSSAFTYYEDGGDF